MRSSIESVSASDSSSTDRETKGAMMGERSGRPAGVGDGMLTLEGGCCCGRDQTAAGAGAGAGAGGGAHALPMGKAVERGAPLHASMARLTEGADWGTAGETPKSPARLMPKPPMAAAAPPSPPPPAKLLSPTMPPPPNAPPIIIELSTRDWTWSCHCICICRLCACMRRVCISCAGGNLYTGRSSGVASTVLSQDLLSSG
mmetsp:Transcript_69972/g.138716  ORF Transcript_69972/g.138716 Transcript_69972/m.138716 type:complete len:201 (+) Transcript_69972:706-1308(+)